jgi:hypothetical protein
MRGADAAFVVTEDHVHHPGSRNTLRLRSTMRRVLGNPMVCSDTSCVMVWETVSIVSPRLTRHGERRRQALRHFEQETGNPLLCALDH